MNELYEMEWRRIYLIPKNFNRNDIYCFRLKKRMKFNCKVILALFMFLSYYNNKYYMETYDQQYSILVPKLLVNLCQIIVKFVKLFNLHLY